MIHRGMFCFTDLHNTKTCMRYNTYMYMQLHAQVHVHINDWKKIVHKNVLDISYDN